MSEIKQRTSFIWGVEENSGLVPIENADEKKLKVSRIWNFLEPIITYAITLIVVWVSMLDESLWWMWASLGAMLIWLLILSPIVHFAYEKEVFLEKEDRNVWFYFFDCRGLGSARKYFFSVNGEKPLIKKHLKEIIITLVVLGLIFALALVEFSEEYGEILIDIGLSDNTATKVGVAAILLPIMLVVLALLAFPIMIRLDTYKKALKQIVWTFVGGIPLILIFTLIFYLFPDLPWLDPGDTVVEKLSEFTFLGYVGQYAGYIFWGWLQQMLFLSIFNTMFSRAFDIRTKKGKILAALFSSIFFGLIHLPEFWLSLFTWLAGFLWSLIFMSSKNLWAMGLSHGALATLLNKMTPVPFTVGPTSI